jgi:LPXTG-motif cell wall-anchored protein
MNHRMTNTRALFAAIFSLLLVVAGLYAATSVNAQSGLTIVIDHVDAEGWRAHIEGTCPPGYDMKTRNLEGRWDNNQSGVTVRAHCVRESDGFECWHVTKWVRNPGYVAPARTPLPADAPTATPHPTATPCPDCPVPTAVGQPSTTPEQPTATAPDSSATPVLPTATAVTPPPASDAPPADVAPTATAGAPGESRDTGDNSAAPPAGSPCPSNPDGMPVRWVYRDGRNQPVCEETSSEPAPAPAATATGICLVRETGAVARFDVVLTQGQVARAEYVFSDGTRQVILDEPFSPDEERAPLPSPLEVAVPEGQTVRLDLIVVGYDTNVAVSSNAVDDSCAEQAPVAVSAAGGDAGQAGSDVGQSGVAPARALASGQDAEASAAERGASARASTGAGGEEGQIIPARLPNTGGSHAGAGLLVAAALLAAGALVRRRADA